MCKDLTKERKVRIIIQISGSACLYFKEHEHDEGEHELLHES